MLSGFLVVLCLGAMPALTEPSPDVPVISEIRFEGNRVTRESVMRQELTIRGGDPLDAQALEHSRQALMNMGLFRSVASRVEVTDGEAEVIFSVSEKYYIFPLPRLSRTSDGDIRYGGDLRFDNFLGYNQVLRMRLQWEDAGSDTSEEASRTFSVSYSIPRIPRTAWGLSLSFEDDSVVESASAEDGHGKHDKMTQQWGASITRWLDRQGPSTGWRASLGVNREERRHEAHAPGGAVPEDARVLSWSGGLGFTDVADLGRRREGVEYGVSVSFGGRAIGSDTSHQDLSLYYRAYRPLDDHELAANLNYQARFAVAGRTAFGDEAYSLGGGSNLRGYPRDYREGDLLLLLNTEYLRPLFGRADVRGVGFVDVGGVWPRRDIDLSDVHLGAGLGLRINLRWFVRTDLRLDYAYGVSANDSRVYAGTNHAF
ncbi:BamA/TamA family outer membrane protein [Ectothiorhodospira marina]|uniref:Surface antigen n=1 Tax=Ectothiorhodospira marina TaxID=1396821 RepID=A0A1H7HGT2_9GAMM|nr:BamA/TamA family outer membrane protein [Ectothiorhodospira marina]SEK49521.1 Surface antigen [Ectothiorhodospira marina]